MDHIAEHDMTSGRPEELRLSLEELEEYRAELEARLRDMDDDEPEDMAGEEFEQWADAHESLEDLLSEAEDRIDELM